MGRVRRWAGAAASAAMVVVIWLVGAALMFFSFEVNFGWITPLIP